MTGLMDSDHRNHKSTQTILDGAFTLQETNDGRTLVFSHSTTPNLSLIHISEPTRPY